MRLNVYVPDDLGAQVKAAPINVSRVCQAALRRALADAERARLVEAVINEGREW